MPYIGFQQDRPYLTGKFRNPVFPEGSGMVNDVMRETILTVADRYCDQPRQVVKARCFEFVCRNMQIDVNSHDYFPAFGCYDRTKRPLAPLLSRWSREADELVGADVVARINAGNAAGVWNIWRDFDHSVPDWDAIFSLGFSGLRTRAAGYRAEREKNGTLDADARAYFDGLEITVSAVLDCLDRLVEFGRARQSEHARVNAQVIALEQLRNGTPRDTYEALLLIYLHFIFCEHIDHMQVRSLGNLDVMLAPFYERDLREKRYTEMQIREFFACFLMQFASINNYWGHPFYLGGSDANGGTLYNPLSELILDVFDRLSVPTPKIQLKIAGNTPKRLVDKALDMIRRGNNSLVFLSEESIRRAMMGCGFSGEEARECDISGCYEVVPRATGNVTCGGHVNMVKVVELLFHDGMDPAGDFRCGGSGAKLTDIQSFDDFYAAVVHILGELIDSVMACANRNERYLHRINPAQMYSLSIENSLKTARDAFSNGSRYNNTSILLCGLGTLVDALMAVKERVFERHELTLCEFAAILNADWKGAEKLRLKCLQSKRKFGNGIAEVDSYAEAIMHYAAARINLRPNGRGGFFIASGHCARQFITMGELTGATPDGRRSGEEFSKNISPTMGADVCGVTALVKSVTTLDSIDLPGGFPLDVMMHPATVQGTEGLAAMRSVIEVYFAGHGIAVHFNIFDAETLVDAQRHPEKYANLQIRVCGWNVRFVELAPEEQNAYIERARRIQE